MAVLTLCATSFSATAAIVGTNSNDILGFTGTVQAVNTTIVNAYSGVTAPVAATLNVNQEIYNGLGGTDTLLASNIGDFLTLRNAAQSQTLGGFKSEVQHRVASS
jgi:hypothetical protein